FAASRYQALPTMGRLLGECYAASNVKVHQEEITPKLLTLENKGIENFQDVVGSEVVELNVQELLNGVDLEGERGKNGVLKKKGNALRLFFSYSHKDESLLNELETHLTLLRRLGVIEPWHDRKIEAGDKWKEEIDENLESADIILLLVSSNFINSDYCYEKEMRYALERHAKKDARVIPIIVREVNWESAPFANPQVLPKDGLAVMSWPDRDAAWRNVSEKIELVAQEMRKESKQQ
ncbi:MAG: toll/interleukin-1 receptor domain-containing protein, partial [Blastocatellia bacterium]